MMRGDVIAGGWRDEHVKESLDLCLACKGCKSDCPVSVDMATYKAEFLAHYYEGRVRPRSAYAMGLIANWARIASHTPAAVNFISHAPGLRNVAKFAAGISQKRDIPGIAARSFRSWFQLHEPQVTAGTRVLLWPDTFNNYFLPKTAQAAVDVLENAGCHVAIPDCILCCGRPLYDYGMIPMAKRWLKEVLTSLEPDIETGTPIVFLEPSCAAVFRDEMLSLFPDDATAKRLSRQTFLFDEYLMRIGYRPPALKRRVVVHGHCHRKALMGMDATEGILREMQADTEILDSGCCGMAGSFGYESAHYDVSIKVGEHVLLPRVRREPADTLIVADGFSCREQIAQNTNRRAMHLSEVLAMALPNTRPAPEPTHSRWKIAAGAVVLGVLAAVLIRRH